MSAYRRFVEQWPDLEDCDSRVCAGSGRLVTQAIDSGRSPPAGGPVSPGSHACADSAHFCHGFVCAALRADIWFSVTVRMNNQIRGAADLAGVVVGEARPDDELAGLDGGDDAGDLFDDADVLVVHRGGLGESV